MLILITGPMFSGKTTEMLRRLDRYSRAGKKTVLVRSKKDTRANISHKQVNYSGDIITLDSVQYIDSFPHEVFGIDEGQFFEDIEQAECLSRNKIVIVSALNLSSEGKPWPSINFLMNHCEELIKLNAVCSKCGSEYAIYSQYNGDPSTKEMYKVGGAELYEARCKMCWTHP